MKNNRISPTLLLFLLTPAFVAPLLAEDSPSPAPELREDQVLDRLDEVQDLFFRRLALRHIIQDDVLRQDLMKREKLELNHLAHQEVALAERWNGESESLARLIVLKPEHRGFIPRVVGHLEGLAFPENLAFEPFARILLSRLQYQAEEESQFDVVSALKRLREFSDSTRKDRDRDPSRRIVSIIKALEPWTLWDWFAPKGMAARVVANEAADADTKIDLNSATREQLEQIPGIGPITAQQILDARGARGYFDAVNDLERIKDIGQATLRTMNRYTMVTDFIRPARTWTVLMYSAGANNLEGRFMGELNDMEAVGSGPDVHIVTQIARLDGREHGIESDNVADGNWTGTRRYYVTKGTDHDRVESSLVASLGDVDSGDGKTLQDFITWGVRHFPAQRYWIIVRNHGGGSLWGIASDDEHDSHIDVPSLAAAVAAGTSIRQERGDANSRIEMLSLSACLMGMYEVAVELEDHADILMADQGLSYGQFEWDECFDQITKDPQIDLPELARRAVDIRMKRIRRLNQWSQLNLSFAAYDLHKLAPLKQAMNDLGESLLSNLSTESTAYTDASTSTPTASRGKYRDLGLVADKLSRTATSPTVIQSSRRVHEILGVETEEHQKGPVQNLKITLGKPGEVLWSINSWEGEPPRSMWPEGSSRYLQKNMVKSPLEGPDAQGQYYAEFPSFDAVELKVNDITFRPLGPRGGLGTERTLGNLGPDKTMHHADSFGPESPLIVQIHTGGYGTFRSFGVVFPTPKDPVTFHNMLKDYSKLKWANESAWGKLLPAVGEALMPDMWK